MAILLIMARITQKTLCVEPLLYWRRTMENHDGYIARLALLLERESRLIGVDIEQEITKITDKIRKKHSETKGKIW